MRKLLFVLMVISIMALAACTSNQAGQAISQAPAKPTSGLIPADATPSCGKQKDGQCGGECPTQGDECISKDGTCQCVSKNPSCSPDGDGCYGWCPEGESCIGGAGSCSCRPMGFEQACAVSEFPACGGYCQNQNEKCISGPDKCYCGPS